MNRLTLFACLFFCLAQHTLYGQATGRISGKVVEKETGENVLFATVQLLGTEMVTSTDLDGWFHFDKVPVGTYSVEVSGISYTKTTVTNLSISSEKPTEITVQLPSATVEIEEYTVEAAAVQNSEASLLAMQQKADAVQDGISSQELERTGAGDAGASMKYVTGASVEDGKYVVVRGLGDRYSTTQINGLSTPSTDPYRNSTSLDLVPTEMLDNIIVSKTFTPDRPGNFTGGNVDITTKSLPEAFFLSLGFGISINTQASFQDDFLYENTPGVNFLGYGTGERDLPEIYTSPGLAQGMNNFQYLDIRSLDSRLGARDTFNLLSKGLPNSFVPSTKFVPFNSSFNISLGNRHTFKNKLGSKLGYVVGLNQSTDYRFYQDGVSAAWVLPGPNVQDLQEFFNYSDVRGTEELRTGALLGTTFWLSEAHEFSFTGMYNHSGEMSSQQSQGTAPQVLAQSANQFTTITNYFMERAMTNLQFKGRHYLKGIRSEIQWMGGYTDAFQSEPDMKLFAYTTNAEGTNALSPAEFDNPFHYFRELNDQVYEAKVDMEVQYTQQKNNTIKFGGFFNRRDREFSEQRFQIDNNGTGTYINPNHPQYSPNVIPLQYDTTPDFSQFFSTDNFGIVDTSFNRYQHSNFLVNQTRASNIYTGFEQTLAAYAMITYDLPKWRFQAGARLEHIRMSVLSNDTLLPEGSIDALNVLPALNLMFKIKDNMNLRAAATMTLARPNLRELAPFVAYDLIGAPSYNGNPDLELTNITNIDLRYEFFFKPGEVIAFSAYGKLFRNPIVRSFNPFSGSTTGEIQFVNVENAQVAGIEFDFRKKLDFIWAGFKDLKFSSNFSLIYSRVDINPIELAQIQSINQEFGDFRPFQGQSPYLINAGLTWAPEKPRFETSLTLNYFADRLSENSQAGTPDIYEVGRAMLNWTASKTFGKVNSLKVSIGVQNLLNANFRRELSYRDVEYVVSEFRIGQTFTVSVNYKFKK